MTTWDKPTALDELRVLIQWTTTLQSELRFSTEHMRWRARSQTFLFQVFGPQSIYHMSLCRLSWSYTGYVEANPYAVEDAHQQAYLKQLESARGLLLAAQDELERSDIDAVYRGKDSAPEASLILKVINLAEHKLRRTIRDAPAKETEVQDAFETLLIGADVQYSRELGGIEYSSKTYVPDFVIAKADLVVEMKLCKPGRAKDIIPQINDDIQAYQTKYSNLLFVVYDVGQIRDIERFSGSFETEKVLVRVVKH